MNGDWLTTVAATFVGLLPIVNPFSTAVVFLALTGRLSDQERRRQLTLACVYATATLLVFLIAGALIMNFFGISIPALRLAGGLIIARAGFSMLNPDETDEDAEPDGAQVLRRDIAFTPLAMPMLSGPGSIAVTISMTAGAKSLWEDVAIAVGIVLVIVVSWLVLSAARAVKGFLGEQGINVLTRIMGFLLVCIGVQFIAIAVVDFAADERVLEMLRRPL